MGNRRPRGFTLTELLIAIAILGVVAVIAFPSYTRYRERALVAQAVADISGMHIALQSYIRDNREPPDSLATIRMAGKLDPWGRPYAYLKLTKSSIGKARKNKNLVPINTEYDLYSTGKDGLSQGPITTAQSRDDVILANDGGYIGKASDYQ